MDLQKIFLSYEGRISRKEFWVGVLVLWVVSIAFNIVFAPIFALILTLLLIYPNFAVLTKRCHDRGKSGWWSLLVFIPIVGFIWMIIDLGVLEGEEGANAYGPNPLAADIGAASY